MSSKVPPFPSSTTAVYLFLLWISEVCVWCIYIFLWVCASIYVDALSWVCVCRPEVNVKCLSPLLSTSFLWGLGLPLNLEYTNSLRLAGLGFTWVHLPGTGITDVHQCECWGFPLRSSFLHSKYIINWVSLQPIVYCWTKTLPPETLSLH